MRRRKGEKVLRPVWPNSGIAAIYRRKLRSLIEEMQASYAFFLKAQYRATPPAMAQDESPAKELERELRRLGVQWRKNFDAAAPALAAWFAKAAWKRSDAALRKILRDAGVTVEFQMTRAMRDILNATVAGNVAMIRSIPEQYHMQVQDLVMRSVQTGRDLGSLAKELRARYGVTERRAALIAFTQNQMATSAMQRARQTELGIEEAVWLHSHAGREPRKTHLANDRKRYNIATGWYDPDPKVKRHIWPGELVNCFPASTRIYFAHDVEKAFRHFYSGELTELVTDSGKSLRATPNHPILAPDGWRPIGSLDEGDYVIEVADQGGFSIVSESYADHAPSSIAEIFEALAESGRRRLVVALGDEFHGDAIADGNVDVVFAARPLSFGRKFLDVESFEQFDLAVPDEARLDYSPVEQLLIAALLAAYRIVGGARESLSLLRRRVPHPRVHCVASIANSSSYSFDPGFDSSSLVPKFFGERKQAASAFVQRAQAVRIIAIERRAFSGHVFNLQTEEGYYSAEGILCHNCRCVSKPVVKGFS
jgi:intein/homing endonuclease